MATYQGESEMARLLRGREERLRMPESGPGPEEAVRLAGEAETEVRVLAGAAACGLRAARWIRGLPLAPDSWTVRTVA
ncbi:hypothetical protein, partial [Streptomyces sp. NPDC088557]|uniref:hypothetical protein n=1 Tax=Streptomyces sp. NPDC088557 TaxID=3365867 RepID=UPI0037F24666